MEDIHIYPVSYLTAIVSSYEVGDVLEALKERQIDLVVLAGYLVVVPPCVIQEYENRIINIHPSLIHLFVEKAVMASCSRKGTGKRRKSFRSDGTFCR